MKVRIKVEKVIFTPKGTLIIFYTPGGCWEFCLIDNSFTIHRSPEIAYTSERAEKDGRLFVARYIGQKNNVTQ